MKANDTLKALEGEPEEERQAQHQADLPDGQFGGNERLHGQVGKPLRIDDPQS